MSGWRVQVYMQSDKEIPLIWDIEDGKGKYLVINSDLLSQKSNRGIVAGAMMSINDEYMYPYLI